MIKIAWSDTQTSSTAIDSTEWNSMVTYIKSVISDSSTISVSRSSADTAVTIDQNGDGKGLYIDSEATTSNTYALDVITGQGAGATRFQTGGGNGAYLALNDDNALGSNYFYRNLASADTAGAVVFIEQDNSGDDQPALKIQQDGTGKSLHIFSSANSIPVYIDNDGDQHSIYVADTSAKSASRYSLYVRNTATGNTQPLAYFGNAGTGTGLFIDQNGDGISMYIDSEATTKNAAAIYGKSNVSTLFIRHESDADGQCIYVDQDSNGAGIKIDNAGTGNGLYIDQNGNGIGARIESTATTERGLSVYMTGNRSSETALYIRDDNSSTTAVTAYILNAGTGDGLLVDQNGDGVALNIDSEATTHPAIQCDSLIQNDGNSLMVQHGGSIKFTVGRNDDVNNDALIYLAGSYLWVDSSGRLRIKSSTPTSDTDGTVVGTQT